MSRKLIKQTVPLLVLIAGVAVALLLFPQIGATVDHDASSQNSRSIHAEELAGDHHEEEDHDANGRVDHEAEPHEHEDASQGGDQDHDSMEEAGHDAAEHEDHDHTAAFEAEGEALEEHDHAHEERVELTPRQRERIGLEIAVAGPGSIAVSRTFPAEITADPDRIAHVVPRASGIVREVLKTIGDRVEAGEILAWIESGELAEAKLAFFEAFAEVGCCEIELPRAQKIYENVTRLLGLLEQEPLDEQLHELNGLEMGEYRGRLLTAYAEYVAARKAYERESALRQRNIGSEQDRVEAERAFARAHAEYEAARDSARYEVYVGYMEAARQRQVAEFEAVAAEQRLRLKGVSEEAVAALRASVPSPATLQPCPCDDPNCQEGKVVSILDTLGRQERFGWYPLTAPFEGVITEKHLPLGEIIGHDESVFTIADMSSVWVRFDVYQGDTGLIQEGQTVRIDLGDGTEIQTGQVDYIAPIVDTETRTASGRIVLENGDGSLRPGLYATVRVEVERSDAPVVIPKSAVQVVSEQEVVFVPDSGDFVPVPVILGQSDARIVEVKAGLLPGQEYVANGGFEIKAALVTRGLGGHAGHGH